MFSIKFEYIITLQLWAIGILHNIYNYNNCCSVHKCASFHIPLLLFFILLLISSMPLLTQSIPMFLPFIPLLIPTIPLLIPFIQLFLPYIQLLVPSNPLLISCIPLLISSFPLFIPSINQNRANNHQEKQLHSSFIIIPHPHLKSKLKFFHGIQRHQLTLKEIFICYSWVWRRYDLFDWIWNLLLSGSILNTQYNNTLWRPCWFIFLTEKYGVILCPSITNSCYQGSHHYNYAQIKVYMLHDCINVF